MGNSRLEITNQLGTRLAALHSLRSRGVVLAVVGEAGIGKTWTIQQVLREAKISSFSFHATNSSSTLLRTLPIPKKFPVWAARILERLTKGEFVDAQALTDALIAQLAGLAPIILHLEDLHEADAEHLELWQGLARIVNRTRGVGLLVTSRSQAPEPFETLKIEPLSNQETRDLLEAEVSSVLPVEACDWIFARSVGNPLFALEYFRFLARAGFLWNDASRWHWRVPPKDLMPVTVEALIERQITEACQTSEIRDALESKAMLSLNTASELWLEVSGLSNESLEASRVHLEQRGLFAGNEFAHPLFREVALKTSSLERRQHFARRALKAFEHDPEKAVQFVEAAKLEASESLAILERAAERSKVQGNSVQAARFLARAVEFATGESKGQLALKAANAIDDRIQALRLAEIAVALLPDDVEAIYCLAEQLALVSGQVDMERLLERLPEQERNGEEWLARLASLYKNTGDLAAVLQIWKEHSELHNSTQTSLVFSVALAMISYGQHDEADVLIDRILLVPDLSPKQQAQIFLVRGLSFLNRGKFQDAVLQMSKAIALSHMTDDLFLLTSLLFNRSNAYQALGQYPEALKDLNEAAQHSSDVGEVHLHAGIQMLRGEILKEFGHYEQAEELLLESRQVMAREPVPDHLADCEDTLSRLYLEWQPPHGSVLALRHAQASLEYARVVGRPRQIADKLYVAALAQARYGNHSHALELAQQALDMCGAPDLIEQRGTAFYALGLALEQLNQNDAAMVALQQALKLTGELKIELLAHKISLEIDRLTQNLEGARAHLVWFEERGLKNGANITRRYFPELDFSNKTRVSAESKTLQARLEVLGSMQLRQDQKVHTVRGQKRCELLANLLEARIAGRTEVSPLEFIDRLYPETLEGDAIASIRQLVFQTRSSLGEGLIQTTANGYALGAVDSDVEAFLKNADVHLWRGAYFEGISIQTQSDETVRDAVYHALLTRLPSLLETQASEIVRLCRILLEYDPYNLEVWKLNLQALRSGDNYRGLNKRYLECRAQLLEIGEHLPERWNEFLEPASLI